MNNSQQEETEIQETEFGGGALSTQKRIIHFSSGETLEDEDSEEEEEQLSKRGPFTEPAERSSKTQLSFRNVAILVGRISLLTCDFLGERVAAALGLNAAKYQYAIDQHHRDHKDRMEGQAETSHLSPGLDLGIYGATGDIRCPAEPRKSRDEKHMDRNAGCHNGAYDTDED